MCQLICHLHDDTKLSRWLILHAYVVPNLAHATLVPRLWGLVGIRFGGYAHFFGVYLVFSYRRCIDLFLCQNYMF